MAAEREGRDAWSRRARAALGAKICPVATPKAAVMANGPRPEALVTRGPHILWVGAFGGHTISGRELRLFNGLRRHFRVLRRDPEVGVGFACPFFARPALVK
jgi:hypothetical protein